MCFPSVFETKPDSANKSNIWGMTCLCANCSPQFWVHVGGFRSEYYGNNWDSGVIINIEAWPALGLLDAHHEQDNVHELNDS